MPEELAHLLDVQPLPAALGATVSGLSVAALDGHDGAAIEAELATAREAYAAAQAKGDVLDDELSHAGALQGGPRRQGGGALHAR